jgi:hypothetical protein
MAWMRRELARRKDIQAEVELASTRLEHELAQYRAQNQEHEELQVRNHHTIQRNY